jgi:hypothetical protein
MDGTGSRAEAAPMRWPVLRFWPAALGSAAAAFQIATGLNAQAVAITVAVAASCYLAAAALGLPWMAWVNILVGSVVVTVSEIAGIPWWVGLGVFAAVLVVVGLVRPSPGAALTAQSLAMLVFGGVAVAGALASPRLGLAVAGVALACHAAWDYRHWRRKEVVPRSLAEFCLFLDIPFGVAAIVLALTLQ